MKCRYSLSFEFENDSPITVKGEAEGTSIRTVIARAVDDAVEKYPKTQWASVVVWVERIKEINSERESSGA